MIRLLTVEELPLAAELGPLFYDEGKLPGAFFKEVFIENWEKIISNNIGFIVGLLDDQGKLEGILGAIMSADVNNAELYASEMFWFVRKEARGHSLPMLAEYEKEASNRGAVRCLMGLLIGLHPDALGRIYEHHGYAPLEKTYLKKLSPCT